MSYNTLLNRGDFANWYCGGILGILNINIIQINNYDHKITFPDFVPAKLETPHTLSSSHKRTVQY